MEKGFYLTIPVGINYLFKLKNKDSYLDAGLGVTWARFNGEIFSDNKILEEEYHFTNFIPSIGYRKHIANNVMWRVSIMAIANKYVLSPWIGFAIGKRF
jgi:hypothetical protein